MNTMSLTAADTELQQSRLAFDDEQARASFVQAMATAPTSVTVVAHENEEGLVAQTVSAFASVCAEPPTLLVCINSRSPLHERLADSKNPVFTVSVLNQNQSHLADSFAGRRLPGITPYDVEGTQWQRGQSGMRHIEGAASSFDCEVQHHIESGTHGVFIARVLETRNGPSGVRGLAYCERSYRELY